MIKEKFYYAVREHKMFSMGDSVVAAVSGGADSICLLSLLLDAREKMGITVNCAHINHNLRTTSKRDEDFVREICDKNNVPFFLDSPDIALLAKQRGESEETCGRNERYRFFFETAKKTGSCVILTAHNKEDSAETVLMHLLRGSGLRGLRGIPAMREDGIGRPLITVSRDEIEEYLSENNFAHIEDETNADDKYRRNFVRLNILPILKDYNPSVVEAITRVASAADEDDSYLTELAENVGGIEKDGKRIILSSEVLGANPDSISKRVIARALSMADIEPSMPDIMATLSLATAETGKKHIYPCGKEAVSSYGSIIVDNPKIEKQFLYRLYPEEEIYVGEIGKKVLLTNKEPSGNHIKIRHSEGKFEIRSRCDGDRFSPYNMNGTKKLKDFFIDEKIPREERWEIPIITCDGKIAAVGCRVDNDFCVKKGDAALFIIIQ